MHTYLRTLVHTDCDLIHRRFQQILMTDATAVVPACCWREPRFSVYAAPDRSIRGRRRWFLRLFQNNWMFREFFDNPSQEKQEMSAGLENDVKNLSGTLSILRMRKPQKRQQRRGLQQ